MPDDTDEIRRPDGILLVDDLAKMLGVKSPSIWQYMKESKEFVGGRPGRYFGNPFPPPCGYMNAGKKVPWWRQSRRGEVREWDRRRLGLGHGTGGRRAGSGRS